MYGALKAALFRLDPERAHHLAMAGLRRLHQLPVARRPIQAPPADARLATSLLGIPMDNPLGLAAGFDKDAEAYNALLALGFGHVEVGTVTPVGQPGNPKPRIHRLPEQEALVNSMGFPGRGFAVAQHNLARHPATGPVGLNIGPNKDAPADVSLARLQEMASAAQADYVALNVSSPNTPGLRELQHPDAIHGFVAAIRDAMDDAGSRTPLLLKLHPDAHSRDLIAVANAAVDAGAAGLIATNTTRQRYGAGETLPGGLSGRPLRARAVAHVRALRGELDVPIIGVGGVSTGQDVLAMLQAGATVVQGYTGFVYRGPTYPRLVQTELLDAMDKAGIESVRQLQAA